MALLQAPVNETCLINLQSYTPRSWQSAPGDLASLSSRYQSSSASPCCPGSSQPPFQRRCACRPGGRILPVLERTGSHSCPAPRWPCSARPAHRATAPGLSRRRTFRPRQTCRRSRQRGWSRRPGSWNPWWRGGRCCYRTCPRWRAWWSLGKSNRWSF